MKFPFKDDKDIAALERLPHTAFAYDDRPYLSTQRYSLSPDYEISDVVAKARVDLQSAQENQWYLWNWKKQERA